MLEEIAFDAVRVHDLKKPVIIDSLGYESHARIRNLAVHDSSETHSQRVYDNTRARSELNPIVPSEAWWCAKCLRSAIGAALLQAVDFRLGIEGMV